MKSTPRNLPVTLRVSQDQVRRVLEQHPEVGEVPTTHPELYRTCLVVPTGTVLGPTLTRLGLRRRHRVTEYGVRCPCCGPEPTRGTRYLDVRP